MELKGRVWKFGKDVDTDELFAGRFLMGGDETSQSQYQEFIARSGLSDVEHRENVPRDFLTKVRRGDIIVAEQNFGIGSSRQQAAETLKFKGVQAVVADSIHRIFFRNFWNLGCPAIDLPGISTEFKTGHEIAINLRQGTIRNLTTGKEFEFRLIIPPWFIDMVEAGGLIPYHKSLQNVKSKNKSAK
ncbi:MAG TPA: 3-isopropylmalate dehydratase small subunit [Dehalococcoidia bacterium]|nr:3-isopropylmalate dehydratase small subunit [Dehalococcoidia bacterium]